MKKIAHYSFVIVISLFTIDLIFSQSIGINATGAAPDNSAGLDLNFNDRGLLIPRLTTTQRNAIVSPANSLMIFNTDNLCFEFYNAPTNSWVSIACGCTSLPTVPTANAASGITQTTFTANWTASTGATGYYLDVATDAGFTSFVSGYNNLNVGNITSYNVTGLTCGTTYYYRVRAYNQCGTSANSISTTVNTSACCSPVQYLVGTNGTSTTNSNETPFSTFWHDTRRQYIITAAEMTAAGFCPGVLTAMQINVSSTGSPCMSNFTIKIKNTTTTTLAAFELGTTTVFTSTSHCPTLGWNTYTFSTPHYWDGTSNILVEICFDNGSYSSNYGVFCETVPAGRAYGGYNDGVTGACNYTGWSNNVSTTIRPAIRFNGLGI